jgi:hypothetical protein
MLLAIGLLNHADDEGYFKANPRLVQAAVFPLRDPSTPVDVALSELEACGYIELFSGADGRQYGRVVNFEKHQAISKPQPSAIKELRALPEHSRNAPGTLPERSRNAPRTVTEDSGNAPGGKGKEGKGKDPPSVAPAAPTMWDVFVGLGGNRSLLGKLAKQHGEEAAAGAVASCERKRPADPNAYIRRVLEDKPVDDWMQAIP